MYKEQPAFQMTHLNIKTDRQIKIENFWGYSSLYREKIENFTIDRIFNKS